MRAVIYNRVSHDPQGIGRSVSEQEADNHAVCAREDWTVVKVFTDNDKGASRYSNGKREQWQELTKFLETGQADVLVTWEASRAQRDMEAYTSLRKLCEKHNILYCYGGRVYDLSTTDDRFATGLDALVAEKAASDTSDRVKRAVRHNAMSGRPHGKLLYGYQREYHPVTKQFVAQVPNKDQAKIIQEIFSRAERGDSCYGIAQDLNSRGVPTAKGNTRWSPIVIRQLLRNPAYIGKRVFQREIIGDGQWPALIDDVTFYAVKRILDDPERKSHRDGATTHLLSGILRCGVCGSALRVRKNGPYISYVCIGDECFGTSIKKSFIDEYIEKLVIERLAQPDIIEILTRDTDDETRQALNEAAELRVRLENFYESAAKGEITPTALAHIESQLLPEIAETEKRASSRVSPVVRQAASPEADKVWARLPLEQKRKLLRELLTLKIMPIGKGKFTQDNIERVMIVWKS